MHDKNKAASKICMCGVDSLHSLDLCACLPVRTKVISEKKYDPYKTTNGAILSRIGFQYVYVSDNRNVFLSYVRETGDVYPYILCTYIY